MSIIYINSYQFAGAPPSGYDPDAAAYIARVEGASGDNAPLETAVKDAINAFVVGCKADGIWSAIKASCILAGARTLGGALVPLAGTAPTPSNFIEADYARKTGLLGGSGRNLNSNRANNADPQDSQHAAVYCTEVTVVGTADVLLGSDPVATQGSTIVYTGSSKNFITASRSAGAANQTGTALQPGLAGVSRATSAEYVRRFNGSNSTVANTSRTPTSTNLFVFDRGPAPPYFPADSRLAFYSIGESLDLELLDTRVTTLINAFAAAIP